MLAYSVKTELIIMYLFLITYNSNFISHDQSDKTISSYEVNFVKRRSIKFDKIKPETITANGAKENNRHISDLVQIFQNTSTDTIG